MPERNPTPWIFPSCGAAVLITLSRGARGALCALMMLLDAQQRAAQMSREDSGKRDIAADSQSEEAQEAAESTSPEHPPGTPQGSTGAVPRGTRKRSQTGT